MDKDDIIKEAKAIKEVTGCGIQEATRAIETALKRVRTTALMILYHRDKAVVRTRNCRVCKRQYVYQDFFDICCKNDFIV